MSRWLFLLPPPIPPEKNRECKTTYITHMLHVYGICTYIRLKSMGKCTQNIPVPCSSLFWHPSSSQQKKKQSHVAALGFFQLGNTKIIKNPRSRLRFHRKNPKQTEAWRSKLPRPVSPPPSWRVAARSVVPPGWGFEWCCWGGGNVPLQNPCGAQSTCICSKIHKNMKIGELCLVSSVKIKVIMDMFFKKGKWGEA